MAKTKKPVCLNCLRNIQLPRIVFNDRWFHHSVHVHTCFSSRQCYCAVIYQWIVPQLPFLIIYNNTWSILIQLIRVMIFSWQSDLINTKESVFSVCDKPYHTNKRIVGKEEEIGFAELCTDMTHLVVSINSVAFVLLCFLCMSICVKHITQCDFKHHANNKSWSSR